MQREYATWHLLLNCACADEEHDIALEFQEILLQRVPTSNEHSFKVWNHYSYPIYFWFL